MRVEVYRAPVSVNVSVLPERAMAEFYRICSAGASQALHASVIRANTLDATYKIGCEVLEHTDKTAIVSHYFDFDDDGVGIFFKLSHEPVIVTIRD